MRAFESQNFLAGLGKRISQRSIADEKTLEYFMHNGVEDPVRVIMEQLRQVEEVSNAFDMGSGIVVENHPHAISDVAEEVAARENTPTPPQTPLQTSLQTPNHKRNVNQLRPDQICVYRSDDDTVSEKRTMIYVSEYKAPHKLTAPHLRAGLRRMNMYKEVVNRATASLKRWAEDFETTLRSIPEEDVVHKDVRGANMLVNRETDSVMLIDFESAVLLEAARRPPAQVVPNKRGWDSGRVADGEKSAQAGKRVSRGCEFAEDDLMARTTLLNLHSSARP
ncbi:EKC/KEOPS complex subunit BUD32 [Fusarium sp. Ph1]|nr:EKC/KEOPS complex subunit BUD32 [Fusarium sp. Ph1]